MAKMNISLPDELKAQMDQHKVNWSSVASQAFKQEVENIAYLNSIGSPVKRRIAESEIQDIGGVEKYAHREGQRWAETHARAIELRRLEADAEDGVHFEDWDGLVRVILGSSYDNHMADWFGANRQFGGDVVTAFEEQYATAFAEGALEVLEAADKAD